MRAVRWALAKLVKIPWAVSGRKYATDAESDAGPTFVWNIKLKSRGGVRWPASPVAGDGILLKMSSGASVKSRNTNGLNGPATRSFLAFYTAALVASSVIVSDSMMDT